VKPLNEFHSHAKSANGFQSWCKVCASKYANEWHHTVEDGVKRARKNQLEYHYGMSIYAFNRMLTAQKGCCAICKANIIGEKVCIDHDHKTSKVRGLLCDGCNIGLGRFKESIEALSAAVRYLRKHK
jgi:hypothetical protein